MGCISTIKSTWSTCVMLAVAALSLSCSDNNMSNSKIVAISNSTTTKIKGTKLREEIGLLKIDITPNYLLYTMSKGAAFLKIADKNSLQVIGEFCLKGNGPSEFIAFDFVNHNAKDKILIQDYAKNTIHSLDVDSSIKAGRTILYESYSLPDQGTEAFQAFRDAQGGFIVKEFNPNEGTFGYSSSRSHQFINLYNERITTNHLNQLMTLADGYEVVNNKIVSLSGNNQIDLICIDNPKNNISLIAKGSLCWKLTDFEEQEGVEKSFYLSLPRFTTDCIVALYCNKGKSEYHITNWNGDFLKILEVDEQIRDFNVDWPNKKIYGITMENIVFVYEISQI